MDPSITIVIPVYNEGESVIRTVDDIHCALKTAGVDGYEIVVVDDGSTDDAAAPSEGCHARLVSHPVNMGYGAALKTGIRAARGDTIVIIDADGTYPPDRIPDLLAGMADSDMVVAARTSRNVHIPLLRKVPKEVLRWLASYVVDRKIPDLNSGLRSFRKEVARQYFHILPQGFSFTSTITLAMIADNYRVRFISTDYHARHGKSKIRPVRDTSGFFTMIVRTCMYFYPLRVFFPLTCFFAALAGAKFVYDIMYQPVGRFVISQSALLLSVVAVQIFVLGLVADLIVRRSQR